MSQTSPRDAADAVLIARVAAGDVEALALIYDRYAGVLMGVSRRILRSEGAAEDVVHDAFLTVCEQAARYDTRRGSFGVWIVMITRNLSIDYLRRENRAQRLRVRLFDGSHGAHVEDSSSSSVESSKLRRALSALSEEQQRTIEAAFFEGLTYAEISQRQEVPLGTVKSRAARALAILRAELLES